MTKKVAFCCSWIILACVAGHANVRQSAFSIHGSDSLFRQGEKPRLVSSQFAFTEGPAVDQSGNVYFTDQPNDRIWKYDTDGKLTLYMENARRANGMYFDNSGNLIACADESNQLVIIAADKSISVMLDNIDGKAMNGPNDVWVHPNGDIYFTDPLYKRPYWNENLVHSLKENVYLLRKGSRRAVVVDDDIEKPNGIVGTADGKWLYVADIKGNKTYRYEIAKDGSLSNRTLFAEQGSDGMTTDERGNVYLTGKGVTVYNSHGERIAQIDVPANWTANVCFGGRERNQLFITATESVFVMEMLVKGVQQ